MTVKELNRDQLDELKERIVTEELDLTGSTPSYRELMEAHDEISDESIFDIYANTDFTEDDFFGTAPMIDKQVSLFLATKHSCVV